MSRSPKRSASKEVTLADLLSSRFVELNDELEIDVPQRYLNTKNKIKAQAEICRDGWINYGNETYPDLRSLMVNIVQKSGKLPRTASFLDKDDEAIWDCVKINKRTLREIVEEYKLEKSSNKKRTTRGTTSRSKSPTAKSKIANKQQTTSISRERNSTVGTKRKSEFEASQSKKQAKYDDQEDSKEKTTVKSNTLTNPKKEESETHIMKTPVNKRNSNDISINKLKSTPDSLPSSPYTSSGSDVSPFMPTAQSRNQNMDRPIINNNNQQKNIKVIKPTASVFQSKDTHEGEPLEQDIEDDQMDDQDNIQGLSYPPLSFVSEEMNNDEVISQPPLRPRISKTRLGDSKNDSLNFSSFSSMDNSSIKTLDMLSLPKVTSFSRINSDDVKSDYQSQFDHSDRKKIIDKPLNTNDNDNKKVQSKNDNKIGNYFTKGKTNEEKEANWMTKSKTKRDIIKPTDTATKNKQSQSDQRELNAKDNQKKKDVIVISSPSPISDLPPKNRTNVSPLTPIINQNYFSQPNQTKSKPISTNSLSSQSFPSPIMDSSLPSIDDSLDNLIAMTNQPHDNEDEDKNFKLDISDDIDLEEVIEKSNQKIESSKNPPPPALSIAEIALQRKNLTKPNTTPTPTNLNNENSQRKSTSNNNNDGDDIIKEIPKKKEDKESKIEKPKPKQHLVTHTQIAPKSNAAELFSAPPQTSNLRNKYIDHQKAEKSIKEMNEKEENSFSKSGNEIKAASTVPIITISGLTKGMIEKIKMLTKKIGGQYDRNYSKFATHLVILCDDSGIPKSTIKFHQAILNGAIIVSYSWILESFKEQKWVDEKDHIVKGHPGVLLSRENIKKNNFLFAKYSFYLHGEYESPSKSDIEKLITAGHGKLLSKLPALATTPREELENESVFVLCHPSMTNEEATDIYFKCGIQPLALHYILDCISQYKILDTKGYKFLEDSEDDEPSIPQSLAF